MVCSFSEDGTFIFTGSNDCCVYVWHWDLDLSRQHRRSSSEAEDADKLSDDLSPLAKLEAGARYTVPMKLVPLAWEVFSS